MPLSAIARRMQSLGAAMEVHRHLGHGFLESVYGEALRFELSAREVPFQSEVPLPVHFKGRVPRTSFRADLVVYGEAIVELKAQKVLVGSDEAQLINYLKAGGFSRGLLLNFGLPAWATAG